MVPPSHAMSNFGYGSSEEHQPVTWWRGHPVFAAHLIVVGFVSAMLVTTVMLFARVGYYADWLGFDSTAVLHGQVWRIVTYGLVNQPSIQFALDMVMIVWFGREVERAFGRRKFLVLYAGVYLAKPLLFAALGLWRPVYFAGEVGAFALFVAFATLFPGAPLLFNILAKWAALILVGIISLMALAGHDWFGLLELWATSGFAYAFVRFQQGHFAFPRIRFARRQPKFRVLPDLKREPAAPPVASAKGSAMTEIDALLDKIAKTGIRSLTAQERAKLEAARADLLKRDPGRR